jgi:uncharacterized protein (TIGR02246 family)
MSQAALAPAMQDIHRRFEAAFNSGDIDAMLALYEPEAVFVASGGEILHGHDEIRTAFEPMFAAKARIKLETVGIVESTDGLVLMHGRWTLTGVQEDGSSFEQTGASAEVLRRQMDGSWRFAIDNPVVPQG